MRSRVRFAARDERATVAVGAGAGPAVRGVLLDDLDALVDPRRGLEPLRLQIGHVADDLLFQEVRDDDAQVGGRPVGGAEQRAPQLDRVEERGAGAAAAQLEDPQLVGAVREVERDAEVADEVDTEARERAPPAEIGDAPGPGREVR